MKRVSGIEAAPLSWNNLRVQKYRQEPKHLRPQHDISVVVERGIHKYLILNYGN